MPKPPDDNDRKRAGTFDGDPEEGAVEMLFPGPGPDAPKAPPPLLFRGRFPGPLDPDRAPKAPPPLDETAPTRAALYGPAALEADAGRALVSLARLPAWLPTTGGERSSDAGHGWGEDLDHAPDAGHGWGRDLDDVLGGGVLPGYMLAVGAASAGSGKTAWVMQIADGLALRTAAVVRDRTPAPLTPVLVLSEMPVQALAWRTLARWTGWDARMFRAGRDAAGEMYDAAKAEQAFDAARKALAAGPLAESWGYMRVFRGGSGELVKALERDVLRWRDALKPVAAGREVWPVLVVDPVQRWLSADLDEVAGLNELAEGLRALADTAGVVVLATSDTNKPAAAGKAEAGGPGTQEWAAGLFRGSYKLQHAVDAALALWRPSRKGEGPAPGLVGVLAKNRWGGLAAKSGGPPGAWRWSTANGTLRFTPATDADVREWTAKKGDGGAEGNNRDKAVTEAADRAARKALT